MEDAEDEPAQDCGPAQDRHGADVLADRYRRHTYRFLCEVDAAVSVARLARQVVARTSEKSPDSVSLDEQKRMYTALDRTHLPALEAAELVERDHAGDTVAHSADLADSIDSAYDPGEGADDSQLDVPSRPG